MEMNPGALPRPGRMLTQEFCPPKLDGNGGGDRNFFWRKGFWNQGFLRGAKNRAKGGHQGWSQSPRRPGGATYGGAVPPGCPGDWWPPSGSTLVILEASVALIFF